MASDKEKRTLSTLNVIHKHMDAKKTLNKVTQNEQKRKSKETRNTLIGSGLGAAAGALAGKKLLKNPHYRKRLGAAIGAGIGGAVGGHGTIHANKKHREADSKELAGKVKAFNKAKSDHFKGKDMQKQAFLGLRGYTNRVMKSLGKGSSVASKPAKKNDVLVNRAMRDYNSRKKSVDLAAKARAVKKNDAALTEALGKSKYG